MTLCRTAPQISVHTADVKQVLRVYSIEVAAREKDDLKEDPIIVRLRKVSGLMEHGAADIQALTLFVRPVGLVMMGCSLYQSRALNFLTLYIARLVSADC